MSKKKQVVKIETSGFVCMVCQQRAQRGHYIPVRLGPHKGTEVKVCRQAECIISAAFGEF